MFPTHAPSFVSWLFLLTIICSSLGCQPAEQVQTNNTNELQSPANVETGPAETGEDASSENDETAQPETPSSKPASDPNRSTTSKATESVPIPKAEPNPNSNPEESESNDTDQTELNPPATAEPASPFSASLLSWNIESEGNDPELIAEQLAEFNHHDVIGLTEVLAENFSRYRDALGKKFRYAYSKTGFNDRMMILFNTDKFELVRSFELDEINFERRYRSPLVVHLQDKPSGTEFMVMINHLARGKAEVRQRQAQQLVDWARDQTIPLVAIGDYNFDYVFDTENGNDAFRIFLRDNIWRWVKPDELIDTNWFDPEPDGKDNYPGSMLDFAFVAGSATEWNAACKIIVRDGDFPDGPRQSDHRPYELLLTRD